MSVQTTKFRAELKYLPVYTCDRCGAQQAGTTARTELEGVSWQDLLSQVRAMRLCAHNMPIGWSSHYGAAADTFRCLTCN